MVIEVGADAVTFSLRPSNLSWRLKSSSSAAARQRERVVETHRDVADEATRVHDFAPLPSRFNRPSVPDNERTDSLAECCSKLTMPKEIYGMASKSSERSHIVRMMVSRRMPHPPRKQNTLCAAGLCPHPLATVLREFLLVLPLGICRICDTADMRMHRCRDGTRAVTLKIPLQLLAALRR